MCLSLSGGLWCGPTSGGPFADDPEGLKLKHDRRVQNGVRAVLRLNGDVLSQEDMSSVDAFDGFLTFSFRQNILSVVALICCLQHYTQGIVSMASAGPNSNTAHFSIVMAPSPHIDGHYVIFGEIISGIEVR